MCNKDYSKGAFVLGKAVHGSQCNDGHIENEYSTEMGDTGIQGLKSLCQSTFTNFCSLLKFHIGGQYF